MTTRRDAAMFHEVNNPATQVNLLGSVELVSGAGPVPLGTAKRRSVLAALALELNRVVPSERLIALVCDDTPPALAKAVLQGHIAMLSRVLGPGFTLLPRASGYVLSGDRGAVDVFAFVDMVTKASREERDDLAVELLASALRLWRGPFLEDAGGSTVAEPVSVRLEELRLAALEDLAGRMISLGRTGRRTGTFGPFRRTYLLAEGQEHGHGTELPAACPQFAPAQLPSEHHDFVGRTDELTYLDDRLLGQDSAIGLLVGPHGAGKTALALRWAHRMSNDFPDGQLFVNLKGFGETEPLNAKAALISFLHALGVEEEHVPDDLDTLAAQYRSLLAQRKVLVVLDNARSIEQVRPLLPGSAHCPVLVTSRHDLNDLVVTEGAAVVAVPSWLDHRARAADRGPERGIAA